MVALLLSSAPSAQAQAGSYLWQKTDPNTGSVTAQSPAFSGGLWVSGYTPNILRPYSIGSDYTETGDSSQQVSSSGDLGATYTWSDPNNPTDPAPSCVVVQTSTAQWSCSHVSSKPSAACADGLSDPELDSYAGGVYQGICAGALYTIKFPDASGVIGLSLKGAYSRLANKNGASSVRWAVDLYPVTINLTGTKKDSSGNQNILVGQRCTASLSGIPSGCTVSNY